MILKRFMIFVDWKCFHSMKVTSTTETVGFGVTMKKASDQKKRLMVNVNHT
jgi:hypothetical protein